MSRHHARVLRDSSGVWVEDLRSTNGTFINGHRVTSRRALRDGDQLKFGDSVGVYRDTAPQGQRTAPQTAPQGQATSYTPQGQRGATGSGGCAQCGMANSPDLWFCSRCGRQQRSIPVPTPAQPTGGPEPSVERLITPHGDVRARPFRRALRRGNGGRRVGYNERLAVPTILFRFLVSAIAVVAIVIAVALADGATASSFGFGN